MEVSIESIGQAVAKTTIEVDPEDYLNYETEDAVIAELQRNLTAINDGALYQSNDCGDIYIDDVEEIIWNADQFEAFLAVWRELKEENND